MGDGAQMARVAQLTFALSSTRECFVQLTRSVDENASRNVCDSYGAEYVGYTQYTPL